MTLSLFVCLFAIWLLLKPLAWSDAAGLINLLQPPGQTGPAHHGRPTLRAVPQRRGEFSCSRKSKQRRGGKRGQHSRTASGPQAHWANIKCRSQTRLCNTAPNVHCLLRFHVFFLFSFFASVSEAKKYACTETMKSQIIPALKTWPQTADEIWAYFYCSISQFSLLKRW